jgi:hypothetical protein
VAKRKTGVRARRANVEDLRLVIDGLQTQVMELESDWADSRRIVEALRRQLMCVQDAWGQTRRDLSEAQQDFFRQRELADELRDQLDAQSRRADVEFGRAVGWSEAFKNERDHGGRTGGQVVAQVLTGVSIIGAGVVDTIKAAIADAGPKG